MLCRNGWWHNQQGEIWKRNAFFARTQHRKFHPCLVFILPEDTISIAGTINMPSFNIPPILACQTSYKSGERVLCPPTCCHNVPQICPPGLKERQRDPYFWKGSLTNRARKIYNHILIFSRVSMYNTIGRQVKSLNTNNPKTFKLMSASSQCWDPKTTKILQGSTTQEQVVLKTDLRVF